MIKLKKPKLYTSLIEGPAILQNKIRYTLDYSQWIIQLIVLLE